MSLAGAGGSGPPGSFDEFDRTVRGMLNRISAENACRLLPLDPSLRSISAAQDGCGDSPPWWAARFAALMLASYLQVIHTNRCARGLAMRSADNVLPAYLDAVAPLLARSPRLVDALAAWFARLLRLQDLCWPTARLVLLAAGEQRDRSTLPPHSLGRLPAELLRGRVLRFLVPPGLPASISEGPLDGPPAGLCTCWDSEDGRRDAAAVLAHILLFAPAASWPRLSAFAFYVIEAALSGDSVQQEGRIYLGASVLVAVAQRLESPPVESSITAARVDGEGGGSSSSIGETGAGRSIGGTVGSCSGPAATNSMGAATFKPPSRSRAQRTDLGALGRMANLLEDRLSELKPGSCNGDAEINGFVRSRAQAAIERVQRAREKLCPSLE